MSNLTIEARAGARFTDVSKSAKELSLDAGKLVDFDFNGIRCVVSSSTDIDFLHRDYSNAHLMKWATVGPDCPAEYTAEIQSELDRRNAEAEQQEREQREAYEAKCAKEQAEFEAKTSGITIDLINPEGWAEGLANNKDDYGSCIFQYAENWAKLMQKEMAAGSRLCDVAESTSFQLGFMGITGYMYGAAVNILSQCWKHGEELKQWHRKDRALSVN